MVRDTRRTTLTNTTLSHFLLGPRTLLHSCVTSSLSLDVVATVGQTEISADVSRRGAVK